MRISENALLLAAFVLYFSLAFIWPTVRVWRQTGINPYVLPSTDDAHGFVTRCMKWLIASLLAYVVVQLAWSGFILEISLMQWEGDGLASAVGWAALCAALFWTLAAQYQMGKSWRIGIDTKVETALVTTGLFAWSRNPIFLAMRVCLMSLLLLQPNAATLALFIAGDLLMQFQVRLEEAFLRERHGARYAGYCRDVRRWL